MSRTNHTVESALRHAIDRCRTLAFLSGPRNTVPPEAVWTGLEELFADVSDTLDAVRQALPPAGLDADLVAEGEPR